MFLMNYLVDFHETKGLFTGDRRKPPPYVPPLPDRSVLFTSVNWLKLKPTAAMAEPTPVTVPQFNPELATWEDLLDMDSGTLVINSSDAGIQDEGHVGIRIGLDPNNTVETPALRAAPPVVTLSICFGRPAAARQRRASPFYSPAGATPANQIVQTTFVKDFPVPNFTDSEGNPTWFYPIGLIRFRPDGSRHRTHRYEFSVGVTMQDTAGNVHHYSHDPDMDIGP
jgi:hypothetical protein